jgi:hypothetical protein
MLNYSLVPRSKRRRNTAASARFRMKKKEREQALERHAKELEERLGRMERDMDSLRKGELVASLMMQKIPADRMVDVCHFA